MNRALSILALALLGCGTRDFPLSGDAGTDAGPSLGDASFSDVGTCTQQCSADLHAVVDCNNNAISKCPSNQGCSKGVCIDACSAAAAAQTSLGCEFYLMAARPEVETQFDFVVANVWNEDVQLAADQAGQSVDFLDTHAPPTGIVVNTQSASNLLPIVNGMIGPGDVALVGLGASSTCWQPKPECGPTVPDYNATTMGHAWHLTSSRPVAVYSSATAWEGRAMSLLLPTSTWGTNYMGVTPDPGHPTSFLPDAIGIVSSVDSTQVTIRPTVDIPAGTNFPGAQAGVPQTYTLNKGDALFLQAELDGSPITATNPIGVFSLHYTLSVPSWFPFEETDSADQQSFSVQQLGNQYAAATPRSRWSTGKETFQWRITGAVDGTALTYDPAAPSGAPTTINAGQTVTFFGTDPFVVTSDPTMPRDQARPFYFARSTIEPCAFLTGVTQPGTLPTAGDCGMPADFTCWCSDQLKTTGFNGGPTFANVVPAQQFLSSYVLWAVPDSSTELVLVRGKAADGSYHDVTVDCLGAPVTGWTDIGASGYQLARLDLAIGGVWQGTCGTGRRALQSTSPFGVENFSWTEGMSSGESAYPGGMGARKINTVVVN